VKTIDGRYVQGEGGAYSYILHDEGLEARLRSLYGRTGLTLKVFKNSEGSLETVIWGKENNLRDCTIIQNLFARHDLAPRVYDIVRHNGMLAQVTDFLEGEIVHPVRKNVLFPVIKDQYQVTTSWDMNPKNFIDGKLVDFQPFRFVDSDSYRKHLKELALKYLAWGSRSDPYQAVFDMPSQRNFLSRVDFMRLTEIDFTELTVLDLGCNYADFANYALAQGANRAVGVDLPKAAEAAFEIRNFMGDWQLDLVGAKLPGQLKEIEEHTGLETFDVVFALSVDRQIGYDSWMAEKCNRVLFLEGHVPDKEHTFRERLERDFESVEYFGQSRDHGSRPVFRCYK
jgi:hypothetical protein